MFVIKSNYEQLFSLDLCINNKIYIININEHAPTWELEYLGNGESTNIEIKCTNDLQNLNWKFKFSFLKIGGAGDTELI